MKTRHYITILILTIFILIPGRLPGQAPEMITARQRDTILLMTARENSHYDIVMVMDVSDSMRGTIEKLKAQAMKVVDFAMPGDTLIFIKFDDSPRMPLIQKIRDKRDLEMFKGWIRKTETTRRFGTDIQSSYYTALETLHQLNEARKKKGEPIRIQYVVFVSDGDDIPPAHSQFRNPASKKSQRLAELIKNAHQEKLIKIIPVGIEFTGYRPKYVRFNPDHIPDSAGITDPEMEKFVEQLKDVLDRKPSVLTSSTEVKVPRAPYQFYIDWLSDKVTLEPAGTRKADEKNSIIYNYHIKSNYRNLEVENLNVSAGFTNTSSGLKGKIVKTDVSSRTIKPGDYATVGITIKYPLNWSFRKKLCQGNIKLTVSGDMAASSEPDPGQTTGAGTYPSPSPSPTGTPEIYTYGFNQVNRTDSIKLEIPVTRAIYLFTALGILTLVLFPLFLLFQVAVPITITLRTEQKARAFNLAHRGKITIGGKADFEIPGTDQVIAEIQRRYRRFVLVEKLPGAIPQHYKAGEGRITLKLGGGFSLNAGGSYQEFEFLPGNQEYARDEESADEIITDADIDDEGGDFQF